MSNENSHGRDDEHRGGPNADENAARKAENSDKKEAARKAENSDKIASNDPSVSRNAENSDKRA